MSDKNPLISNIPPPTELPNFILQTQPPKEAEATSSKFSPVIPSEKNITSAPPKQESQEDAAEKPEAEEQRDELPSMQDIAQALSPLTEGVRNSVLFGWVKSGMKTGVQKAKESIDKVVTTLDPGMAQMICKYSFL